ncbi:hypothetical protein C8R46DRAFT_862789, partial [Mycena filopes]
SHRIHPASLVDPLTHPAALMQLIEIPLNKYVIDYVVDIVVDTVHFAKTSTSESITPVSRDRGRRRPSPYQQEFLPFVKTVLSRPEVTPPTLLTALVYIHRARPHLVISVEAYASQRVFLGALILASKYTNDSRVKNVDWASSTELFGKREVGSIERQFLSLLDWKLRVSQSDLLAH